MHFNHKQKMPVLITALKNHYIHTCYNVPNQITFKGNRKHSWNGCNCQKCQYCQQVTQILQRNSFDSMKFISCKQHAIHDHPPETCIKSDCTETCGICYSLHGFHSHPKTWISLHGFLI